MAGAAAPAADDDDGDAGVSFRTVVAVAAAPARPSLVSAARVWNVWIRAAIDAAAAAGAFRTAAEELLVLVEPPAEELLVLVEPPAEELLVLVEPGLIASVHVSVLNTGRWRVKGRLQKTETSDTLSQSVASCARFEGRLGDESIVEGDNALIFFQRCWLVDIRLRQCPMFKFWCIFRGHFLK